ncbi:S-adenosyl-L-methionine-dependent methyltransferase [Infundibulicybe gibba]|nr:S-adenosyl-L-methionine-dependent methyltransferase [Infundibulicybe gibba]
MARRRPSAFEVSFPEEAGELLGVGSPTVASGSVISNTRSSTGSCTLVGSTTQKRKTEHYGPEARPPKRKQLPPAEFYVPREEEVRESGDLVVAGETQDEGYDPNEDGQAIKPTRILTDFSFFDVKHLNELVSLSVLDGEGADDCEMHGAGLVLPNSLNEEDDGQEDGIDDEPMYVRLGTILCVVVDYTKESEPFCVETQYAWYILRMPSTLYQPMFQHYYSPRRIAQLIISSALARPQQSFSSFIRVFTQKVDIFGRTYQNGDPWDSLLELQEALTECVESRRIREIPIIQHLLKAAPPPPEKLRKAMLVAPRNRRFPPLLALVRNPDLAVLKPENQNPTHVTPRIAALAQGLIRENLVVVGPPPSPKNKNILEIQRQKIRDRVCELLKWAHRFKEIDYRREDRLSYTSRFLKAVTINGEVYKPGDIVVMPIGEADGKEPPPLPGGPNEVPLTATIQQYFWFAKIIFIRHDEQTAHVQWLEHGSQILLQELAHPQELFIHEHCSPVPLQAIVGKVPVHLRPKNQDAVPYDEFFYKFVYNKFLCTFTSIDPVRNSIHGDPPNNCPVCSLIIERAEESFAQELKDENGVTDGVEYRGQKYHCHDFVLFRSSKGPAHIGYVIDISFPKRESTHAPVTLVLQRVGRITDIAGILPINSVKDERHVFLTEERVTILLDDLIRVCFVFPKGYITDLPTWITLSPDNFYIQYTFPTVKPVRWSEKRPLDGSNLAICAYCCQERLDFGRKTEDFVAYHRDHGLRALDLFGGVGAFSHGLSEGSGCMHVTHSIEVSPSAARTFKKNSPDTIVYNQCANIILRHAIKSHQGLHTETPKQLFDLKTPIPVPPMPGEIDLLVSGLPCQSHSALNMYKMADDVKSNLLLTTLSYLDYLKYPKYFYAENVPGFLNYSLNATQAGLYRVEGGLPMGGLKLLVRALLDMGYQIRFGLLQAGHYGTPQSRVRFFIIGAQEGFSLPELPQPTHDFPPVHGLHIKMPQGGSIHPIRTTIGVASHPPVTIDDAIGDLPRFDWKSPNLQRESEAKQRERLQRELRIPALVCKRSEPHCGYQGVVPYHCEPKTSYQVGARKQPTLDLQHFTKCLLPKKVDRVVSIPMEALADYRSLRPDQYEWQFANPSSSVARANYRPGLYGRLDQNGYFPTTVTNVDPTAKQSRVINPYCKRMVTVRELARSQGFPDCFVFEAMAMHRQIGNAVPWPVARALGRELRATIFKKWLERREDSSDSESDVMEVD